VTPTETQRHYADYKLNHELKASAVVGNVRRVEKAFRDWDEIRHEPIARIYLASLLLGKKWKHDEK
jgi:hypothetical protein